MGEFTELLCNLLQLLFEVLPHNSPGLQLFVIWFILGVLSGFGLVRADVSMSQQAWVVMPLLLGPPVFFGGGAVLGQEARASHFAYGLAFGLGIVFYAYGAHTPPV